MDCAESFAKYACARLVGYLHEYRVYEAFWHTPTKPERSRMSNLCGCFRQVYTKRLKKD